MKCNLCGCEIEGYGNNPAPLIENDADRCCDMCDGKYVIPIRLYALAHSLEEINIPETIKNIRRKESCGIQSDSLEI